MLSFLYESQCKGLSIGLDDVGLGAWAGDVYAAAAVVSQKSCPTFLRLINDSKKLSAKQREDVYAQYAQNNILWAIGTASLEEIEKVNIRGAACLAMERAYNLLIEQHNLQPQQLLVDGTLKLNLAVPQQAIVKGDSLSYSIAAASIAAKVERDRYMQNLHKQYPHYGWCTNVGYGTKQHLSGLKEKGVSPFHRKKYKPIMDLTTNGYGVESNQRK